MEQQTFLQKEVINPFLESVSNVLVTMATLDVSSGKIGLKQGSAPAPDITGYLTMNSPKMSGAMAISFSTPVILELTKRLLGEEVTSIDDTVVDVVGEVTNMIVGGAKRLLDEMGYDFDMAQPLVLVGKEQEMKFSSDFPVITIPFTTEVGEFYVEMCFFKNDGDA